MLRSSSFLPPQNLSNLSSDELKTYKTELKQKINDIEHEQTWRFIEDRINRHISYVKQLDAKFKLSYFLPRLIKAVGVSILGTKNKNVLNVGINNKNGKRSKNWLVSCVKNRVIEKCGLEYSISRSIYGYYSVDAFISKWFDFPNIMPSIITPDIIKIIISYLLPPRELGKDILLMFLVDRRKNDFYFVFTGDDIKVDNDEEIKIPQVGRISFDHPLARPVKNKKQSTPRIIYDEPYRNQTYKELISLCEFLGIAASVECGDNKYDNFNNFDNFDSFAEKLNYMNLTLAMYCFMAPLVDSVLPQWIDCYCSSDLIKYMQFDFSNLKFDDPPGIYLCCESEDDNNNSDDNNTDNNDNNDNNIDGNNSD